MKKYVAICKCGGICSSDDATRVYEFLRKHSGPGHRAIMVETRR